TPTATDHQSIPQIALPHSAWRTILTPPGWTRGEWKDPYVHLWEAENNKKGSYTSYLFTTSVFGEYTFEFLPAFWWWAMLLAHLGIYLGGWIAGWREPSGKLAIRLMATGVVLWAAVLFRTPYASVMDFRYLAWMWLPAGILGAISLERFGRPAEA